MVLILAAGLWIVGLLMPVATGSMSAGVLLSQLLIAAAPAVPFALQVLQDTNHVSGVRANAATVLGGARVSNPEIQAALLNGTQAGQDVNLRSNCAMALWRLDPQFAPLATRLVLEEIVESKKRFPGNEQNFAMWLEVRDLNLQESIPALKELQQSDFPDLRREAEEALRRIALKMAKASEG